MKIKQSDSLRNRTEQHKVKNEVSRIIINLRKVT